MKSLALCLGLGVLEVMLVVMMPAPVAAQDPKVYVDGTGAGRAGSGSLGSPSNPVRVGSPPNFEEAVSLLPNGTGTIVYIFQGGTCDIPVQNGQIGELKNCTQNPPPPSGCRGVAALPVAIMLFVLWYSRQR